MAEPSLLMRMAAANIKRIMAERGVKQKQLAAILSLSEGRISEILRPRYNIDLDTVQNIATALGVKPSALLEHAEVKEAIGAA